MRLPDYDYSLSGFYYVTIVVYKHQHFFGRVVGVAQCGHPLTNKPQSKQSNQNHMELNHAGTMINEWWNKIPKQFNNVLIHDFVIMPNHMHGIVEIVKPSMAGSTQTSGRPHGVSPTPRLSDIIHWFKTKTTNDYIHGVHANFWPEYEKQFWQKSFYDHIIRGKEDMLRIQSIKKPDVRRRRIVFSLHLLADLRVQCGAYGP